MLISRLYFQDVSTPYKASDKEETVDITFEGDPKSETVYALRLSYGTFSQTIPSTYSYEGKSSRFLISPKAFKMENLIHFMNNLRHMIKLRSKVFVIISWMIITLRK